MLRVPYLAIVLLALTATLVGCARDTEEGTTSETGAPPIANVPTGGALTPTTNAPTATGASNAPTANAPTGNSTAAPRNSTSWPRN